MNINDIHDFVYEGDEDYELDDLDPDSFEVRIGIELVTGGSALMTVQADSKDDAIAALAQADQSDVISHIIDSLENL
ncbi:hypothetical protein [Mycobacteroides abscessus]|uniref:hypothetical protein n=1 Tax=Mycobacteroides abscessus TaxID=36809 RepID=UPI000C26BDAF|nr:hypothetical protein [Mycobacteroides abscessus]